MKRHHARQLVAGHAFARVVLHSRCFERIAGAYLNRGGQKQRLTLARAMAIEPAVLPLDQPLAALDAKLRETLRIELKRLLGSLDVTSILVTHDQAKAMALGAGLIDATLQMCAFLGNLSLLELLCDDGQRILAETRAPPAVGARVGIALDPATFLRPDS